ncbi:MAG: arylsulfotransferase family protein, partial [Pseudomonadota bacterium]
MERSIPVWFFLLCLIFGALFTMVFGWSVLSTSAGNDRSGMFGRAAVEFSKFPTTTKDAILEVLGYASGDYKDAAIRVRREENDDYSVFVPVPAAAGIDVPGLLMRTDRTKMTPGWRMLGGAFHINDSVENAVVLISPDLQVVRKWVVDEVPVGEFEPRPKFRKFVHGTELLRDGSLVFTFDGSVSLQRFDACGGRVWAIPGRYHHAVTADDTGTTVWTFVGNDKISQVKVSDGSVLREISTDDIIRANPMIDILEIRRDHLNDLGENTKFSPGKWMADPFHFNDVDPLPTDIADRFDRFEAGDLLVSARSLNLVFVLDPDTFEIKWWRSGAVQRQHDPDWLPNGNIMVFNNRMSRDFSEIVQIDPSSMERQVVVDGRELDFYSRIRGKQQSLPDGSLV